MSECEHEYKRRRVKPGEFPPQYKFCHACIKCGDILKKDAAFMPVDDRHKPVKKDDEKRPNLPPLPPPGSIEAQ